MICCWKRASPAYMLKAKAGICAGGFDMKKKWMLSAIGVLCLGLLAGCDKPVESTPVFSAPSSVPTSAPAVASHEPEQAHTPLPAPQLHELQSYA